MDDQGGDKEFISEEVVKILEDSVNNLFGIKEENVDKEHNAPYNKEKATPQVNQLIDVAIRGLCKLNKPFKYCVTAVMMQNNGAGMNSCGTICGYEVLAYNDPNTDGVVTVQREVGDNIIIMTVFANLI